MPPEAISAPPEEEEIRKECGDNWISNFMSYDYYGDGIQWIFSGYPHDECPCFLTEIKVFSSKYHVFDVKPGDDVSSSMEIIENQGFELAKGNEQEWSDKVYAKGDLYITIMPIHDYDKEDYSKVEAIEIGVRTFYLGNRIY